MEVFRIASKRFASDISGTGAAMYGGRWNKKGTPVLYTSESVELALLETVVQTPPLIVPDLDLLTIRIPEDSMTTLGPGDLPSNWSHYPAPAVLAEIGEEWARSVKTLVLKVPSCITRTSFNFILNCGHPDYRKRVRILTQEDFPFDSRLNS